jgi:hypothetical protein
MPGPYGAGVTNVGAGHARPVRGGRYDVAARSAA